ncbi:MAG: hypothetical protein HY898_05235 [Deltaproteobacteria bacterium]|nr:hypothetical protein [Deltaproteobacteria bacterium]
MAARVWAAPATDGLLFHNDSVSLCLLVNRRAGTMRIYDFRAGPSASKRTFMLSTARREGIERVFILVEREEVATWTRMGLVREGVVPGFYKRSDGFVLGTALDSDGCLPVMSADGSRLRGGTNRASAQADLDLAEETYRRARLLVKNHAEISSSSPLRMVDGDEGDARKAVWAAGRCGAMRSAFEPFGRDSERMYFAGTVRGAPVFWLSAEIQPCFDHALIEFLTAPRSDRECAQFRTGLELAAERLRSRDVVAMFAFSPIDDPLFASVFIAAGFRRTGLLARHLWSHAGRKDAFLWTRKHPLPGEE